jgi:hypothetical protein
MKIAVGYTWKTRKFIYLVRKISKLYHEVCTKKGEYAMSMNRTKGVKILVHDVLAIFPKPYGEDIILDVCMAIEHNPEWRRRYDELCDTLRDAVVNAAISQFVKEETGLINLREVSTKGKSHLIKSYTKLG